MVGGKGSGPEVSARPPTLPPSLCCSLAYKSDPETGLGAWGPPKSGPSRRAMQIVLMFIRLGVALAVPQTSFMAPTLTRIGATCIERRDGVDFSDPERPGLSRRQPCRQGAKIGVVKRGLNRGQLASECPPCDNTLYLLLYSTEDGHAWYRL